MKRISKTVLVLFLFLVIGALLLGTCRSYPKIHPVPRGELNGALTLDQNWSPEIRSTMNHISFGSHLMPYDWFLHLELADSTEKFISPAHIESLGFIPLEKSASNPDGLPLGFAADKHDDGTWLGLTCTACHSGQVHYQGKRIHVDGAPGMMDFQAFEREILRSLEALVTKEEKFQRLARNIQARDVAQLRQQVIQRYSFMVEREAVNETEVPYGYGRLDAFGQIFNSVAVEALGLDENARSPDAPVSIPVLWDASHLSAVQWNASAPNTEPGPIGQNVTTALAVYGRVDLQSDPFGPGYTSSVKTQNLGDIQANFYLLSAPRWPEDIFGEIDRELANLGQALYRKNCLSCHVLVDASDPKRKIKAVAVPQETLGTDPVMANNFLDRKVNAGVLKGRKIIAGLAGKKLGASVRSFDLVLHAATGVMAHKPFSTIRSILKEWQPQDKAEIDPLARNYKARPLNALWASAPYLHNGSVPTVYDLLSPVEERPQKFYVGALDFDPIHMGIQQREEAHHVSLFDTTLYGNSNAGHNFGVHLRHKEKMALIEYLKTL